MAVITKYEAKDGKQFTDRLDADEWDRANFEAWLESGPMINANHLFETASTRSDSYDHTNDRLLARQLLRKYWDKHVK